MSEMLKNRMVQVIEKGTLLNEENLIDIGNGLDEIGESRDKIDVLISHTKNTIIQNSIIDEYAKYDILYNEDYPEIKKIKETFALKEKELLPLLTEIVNERK